MGRSYEPYLAEVLIDEEKLQSRVAELGRQISEDYESVKDLTLVCILKGGVMFLTDLVRHITVPHTMDFMAISSYGQGVRDSTGHVRIVMDLSADVRGKHLLLVEDIVDSGRTLEYITRMLKAREPAEIKICALLDKRERREVDIHLDYVGFEIPDKFVFGYGLDLDEYFRNLPFVGVVREGMYYHRD